MDKNLRRPILVFLALTPLVFITGLNDVFILPKMAWIFLAAAMLLWANMRGNLFTRKNTFIIPALLFLSWNLFSLHRCENIYLGIYNILILILFITLYASLENILKADTDNAGFLIRSIVCVSVAISVYGLLQAAGIDIFRWTWTRSPMSTLGRRNYAAEYIVMVIPWIYYLASAKKGRGLLWATAFLLLLAHLVLTFTRASYMGFFFSSLLFFVLLAGTRGRRKLPAARTPAVIFIVCLLAQSAYPGMKTFEKGTVKSRFLVWKIALQMVRENPVFGVGPGNFEIRYPEYAAREEEALRTSKFKVRDVHNDYLETAVNTGIPGLLLFLYLLFAAGKTCLAACRNSSGEKRLLLAGAASSTAAVLINALASFPLKNPSTMLLFWVNISCIGAIAGRAPEVKFVFPQRVLRIYFILFIAAGAAMSYRALAASRHTRQAGRSRGSEALELAEKAAELNPFSFETLFRAGRAAIDAGDYRKAYIYLSRSNLMHPHHDDTHNNLGMVYFRTGNYSEAEKSFLEAVKLNPVMPETYNNLGAVYITTGRYSKAIPRLEKALSLKKDFAMAAFNLGTSYYMEGDKEKAKEYYEKTLEINPAFHPARERLESLD